MSTIIGNDVCAKLSPADIEQILTNHQGKAEIFEDGIHLDMPECHVKNRLGFLFGTHIVTTVAFFGGICTTGTDGTKFRNGRLLSPDISVWTNERKYSKETALHLYQDGTAPKLVVEFEWFHERRMTKKAFDKVLNYYFSDNYIGLDDMYGKPTRVEEAWVFIIHPEKEVVPEDHQFRVKCWWGYVPIVNEILITIVKLFVAIVDVSASPSSGWMWRWSWTFLAVLARCLCWMILDVVPGRPAPPINPLVPYLAIYFRNDRHHPMFYHLHSDQVLIAPWNSGISLMKPLYTNWILSMY